jgi:hypothetical protein
MKATLARADVAYEVSFKKPLFDREREAPPLLQSLYDALSDNFPISLNDISTNMNAPPAQVSATIGLFGGAGWIELRLDRWRAGFRNLRTEEDRKLIIRCLDVAGRAIQTFSDRLRTTSTVLNVSSWLVCDQGMSGVATLLSNHGSLGIQIDRGFLGAEEIHFSINPRLRNSTEGWDVIFLFQASAMEGTHLFANFNGTYIEGGRYNTIDQRAEHVRVMLSGMLEKLGVELTGPM